MYSQRVFFAVFLHIQNKWTWYISLSELSIFALQLCCGNSRPELWVTAKQSPASSREMFLWKQRMCLRWLHPLWTLISWLQAPALWIMLFVGWLLLECNSFVSKGWYTGQSSKLESVYLGWERGGAAPSALLAEDASGKKRRSNILFAHNRKFLFMTPLHRPQLFFIQCSRRSKSERSQKTTHRGHIVCFWQTVKEREINLSVSNLFLPTAAVGFWSPLLFAVAPGTVI